MSFLLYLVGFIVFVSGLAWLATLAGVPQALILPGAVILLAIGLYTAIRMRASDSR